MFTLFNASNVNIIAHDSAVYINSGLELDFKSTWPHCLFIKQLPGGPKTPIWNRQGCSSEILNLTTKGDHLGMAQAFCDP